MQPLTLSREDAILIYKSADETGKKILEDKFGTLYFKQTSAIEEFKDFCNEAGITQPDQYIIFPNPTNGDQKSINAYSMLIQIYRHYNKGEKRDWTNGRQKKYYAWYNLSDPSGFGLSFDGCDYGNAGASVASRLTSLNSGDPQMVLEKYPNIVSDYIVEKD